MARARAWRRILLPLAAAVWGQAAAASTSICEQAGAAAERMHGLPTGLLVAIGRVESGRWDPGLGRTVPWPWAVNLASAGRHAASRDDAIATVADALAQGMRNIDVGCFQINLLHHPLAFSGLTEAFDPTANALYAARFLAELKARLGSWTAAVEAYHSADPARAIPYGRNVMASWGTAAAGPSPSFTSATRKDPVVAYGMRIWTPTGDGHGPRIVSIGTDAGPMRLPHVEAITTEATNSNR